jgi:hypothetical protein
LHTTAGKVGGQGFDAECGKKLPLRFAALGQRTFPAEIREQIVFEHLREIAGIACSSFFSNSPEDANRALQARVACASVGNAQGPQ